MRNWNRSTHGRPQHRFAGAARRAAVGLLVFLLALLLVTGLEAVVGHPLSDDHVGHTSLGELLHPGT